MNNETEILTIGEKVYWDCIAGMVKAVVVGIKGRELSLKITALRNPVYKHGEIVSTGVNWVIPRKYYRKSQRGPFHYYLTNNDYIWKQENK